MTSSYGGAALSAGMVGGALSSISPGVIFLDLIMVLPWNSCRH